MTDNSNSNGITDIRTYPRALSSEEIEALHTIGPSVCTACGGKGTYSRCFDEVGSDDFGGEGYRKKAVIEHKPCRKCKGTGKLPTPSNTKRLEEIRENIARSDEGCNCGPGYTLGCPVCDADLAAKEDRVFLLAALKAKDAEIERLTNALAAESKVKESLARSIGMRDDTIAAKDAGLRKAAEALRDARDTADWIGEDKVLHDSQEDVIWDYKHRAVSLKDRMNDALDKVTSLL